MELALHIWKPQFPTDGEAGYEGYKRIKLTESNINKTKTKISNKKALVFPENTGKLHEHISYFALIKDGAVIASGRVNGYEGIRIFKGIQPKFERGQLVIKL